MEIPSLPQDIQPPPEQGRGSHNESRCQILVAHCTKSDTMKMITRLTGAKSKTTFDGGMKP
jgi:hypothetical protein